MKESPSVGQVLFAILPVVTGGTIPIAGYSNLVWGCVFGLPGVLFHWTRISHPLWTDLIWILVWPGVAIFLLGRLGRWIWELHKKARTACLFAFAATFAAVAPVEGIMTARWGETFDYYYLPLYVKLLAY